jgi:hypothetical protein
MTTIIRFSCTCGYERAIQINSSVVDKTKYIDCPICTGNLQIINGVKINDKDY